MNEVTRWSDDINMPWYGNGVGRRIPHEGCKFCASKLQKKAEAIYAKTEQFKRVHEFLKDGGEDISYSAVRRHLKFHLVSQEHTADIREYVGEIEKWVHIQHDSKPAMLRALGALERELMIISAMNEAATGDERRKNADTMTKLAKTLLDYRVKLADIEKGANNVMIMVNKMHVIVKDQKDNAKTKDGKQVAIDIWDAFAEECGDIVEYE